MTRIAMYKYISLVIHCNIHAKNIATFSQSFTSLYLNDVCYEEKVSLSQNIVI